jgi:NAD(P)H dehydrogenase (quinone)
VIKVLVLYYSTYGHTEALAQAVAYGARSTGARVSLKRVPELMSPEIAAKAGAKRDQFAQVARPEEFGRLRRHHRGHTYAFRSDVAVAR